MTIDQVWIKVQYYQYLLDTDYTGQSIIALLFIPERFTKEETNNWFNSNSDKLSNDEFPALPRV